MRSVIGIHPMRRNKKLFQLGRVFSEAHRVDSRWALQTNPNWDSVAEELAIPNMHLEYEQRPINIYRGAPSGHARPIKVVG